MDVSLATLVILLVQSLVLHSPLTVTELQLAGKRRMNVKDFLRGFHVADDCRVG